jgi:hypothetical protein
MLKITAETEEESGQKSGFRALQGKLEKQKERIMNDGESFVALFFGFWDGFFCSVAKHFFLLYKNENDGDDDDEGGFWCAFGCCVHVK